MKKIIDANVILRYLLDDNKDMAEQAEMIIQEGAQTLPEIIAEVVYVLTGVYNMKREDVAICIVSILNLVETEYHDILVYAINLFKEKNLDFVDCILIAYNHINNVQIFSFDKKLNRELNI